MTSDLLTRWRWLGRIALLAVVAGGIVAGSTSRPPESTTVGAYGSGIGADALANMQVGGTSSGSPNQSVAFRFRASTSSSLENIRIYLVDGSGYAGGDGGTMSISVQTDDGSASHGPSGTVLASATIRPGNPIAIGSLPLVSFSSPAALTAGQLYHIVFRNTDAAPAVNYVSVDGLWTDDITTPRQPGVGDLDWAELINEGAGWAVLPDYTPILDLGYANGPHQGMGYMEVWVNARKAIAGASAVREIITPTSGHSVSSVLVRVSRTSGASPLTIQLIASAGGTVLGEGVVPAATFGSGPAWAAAELSEPVVLETGTTYQLVLSAPADSSYSAFAIERGDNFDFDAATYFGDGHAEYTTTGSSWAGFDQPGGAQNNLNSDLQFYFP